MKKKILWLSRHPWLPRQLEELRRLFGEIELVQDPKPFSNAEEIFQRFKEGGFAEIVVVAPLSVIAKLCDLGLKPLWAEMEVVEKEQAEVEAQGRFYRFVRFRRIKAVKLEFEEID